MHEFEDERPIPLGRATTATTPRSAEPAPQPVEATAASAPAPAPTAAHIEKTRERAAPRPDEPVMVPAAVAAPAAVELQVAEVTPPASAVPVEPGPAAAPIEPPPHAPAGHPMAAVGALRFQVELVEPAVPVRDLARFVFAYVVVAGFVLGLIVAFLALSTQLGSGGA